MMIIIYQLLREGGVQLDKCKWGIHFNLGSERQGGSVADTDLFVHRTSLLLRLQVLSELDHLLAQFDGWIYEVGQHIDCDDLLLASLLVVNRLTHNSLLHVLGTVTNMNSNNIIKLALCLLFIFSSFNVSLKLALTHLTIPG